jgi:hypothetical protein
MRLLKANDISVFLHRIKADTPNRSQLLDMLKRSMGFSILDDTLGFRYANAVQGFSHYLSTCQIDINGLIRRGERRCETHHQQPKAQHNSFEVIA